MKKFEGEIWYPYTYDLGRYVVDFEEVIPKLLEYDFFLAGFNSVEGKICFKEDKDLLVLQFYSSESPEMKFSINPAPKSPLKEESVLFLSLYRLSEIHHFSANYRAHFQYLRFVLFPIFFKIAPRIKERFLLLVPVITISTTGILTVTFRLGYKNIRFDQLIRLENLYSEDIQSVALPLEVMLMHQHLAALYYGLDVKTEEYQDIMSALKPFEPYENIKMSCGTVEGLRFEQIAENFKYLLIEKLFFKRKLKEADFKQIDRTPYWQCRPTIFLRKFESQGKRASDIYSTSKTMLVKLLFRINGNIRKEYLHSLKNLRMFDDYLLFASVGLTLKVYSRNLIDTLERKYRGKRLQREKLWLNLGTQVIMDYIHTLFMNLKIRESLTFNKPPKSIKALIQDMEDKAHQNYLLETDIVHAGELKDLIQYIKNEMGFHVLEERVAQSFTLHRLKLESIRNDTLFWTGCVITLLLGLGNLRGIADTIFIPIFQLLKCKILLNNPILSSGVLLVLFILTAFFSIRKWKQF